MSGQLKHNGHYDAIILQLNILFIHCYKQSLTAFLQKISSPLCKKEMMNLFNSLFLSKKQGRTQIKAQSVEKLNLQIIHSLNSEEFNERFNFKAFKRWEDQKDGKIFNQLIDLDGRFDFIGGFGSQNHSVNRIQSNNTSSNANSKALPNKNENYQIENVKLRNDNQKTLDLNGKKSEDKQNMIVSVSARSNYTQRVTKLKLQNQSMSFLLKKNTLSIESTRSNNHQADEVHLVLSGFKFPLTLGCQFKIGTKPFQVIQVSYGTGNSEQKNQNQNHSNLHQQHYSKINETLKNQSENERNNGVLKTCKYCLMSQNDLKLDQRRSSSSSCDLQVKDIMISPCKCKGSCSSVHLGCLKTWILTRGVIKKSQKVEIYDYSKLKCQICKFFIPLKIQIPGSSENRRSSNRNSNKCERSDSSKCYSSYRTLNMLEYLFEINERESGNFYQGLSPEPYIFLKQLPESKIDFSDNSHSVQHLIKLKFPHSTSSKQPITIKAGRLSSSCEFHLNQKTISRQHCEFQFNPKTKIFYVKDLGSRYGTQVKLDDNKIDLNEFISTGVQNLMANVNGTMIRVKIQANDQQKQKEKKSQSLCVVNSYWNCCENDRKIKKINLISDI